MSFAKSFIALFVAFQTSLVSASSLDNYMRAPDLTIGFEDFSVVLEGVCNAGFAEYCQNLAFSLERRKDATKNADRIKRLHQSALKAYENGCLEGNLLPCQEASHIYQLGYGVPKNQIKANDLRDTFNSIAKMQCGAKIALACAYQSYWHNGSGNKEYDAHKAQKYSDLSVEYFDKSCVDQVAISCALLAQRFKNGRSYGGFIDYDIDRSLSLFNKSCALGYANACIEIGSMYFSGKYVGRDKLKAAQYDQKGCELGNAIACRNLLDSGGMTPKGAKRGKAETAQLRDRILRLAKDNCATGKLAECSLFNIK